MSFCLTFDSQEVQASVLGPDENSPEVPLTTLGPIPFPCLIIIMFHNTQALWGRMNKTNGTS